MGNFRTSSVFKFTKDFELLKKIIRAGIIPNYCEEDLSFEETKFVVGIPMSSFCDIPISLLDEHNRRYGNYGIALSKEWARKSGLSPVLYVANDDILRAVYFHHHYNEKEIERFNRPDVKEKMIRDAAYGSFPLGDYARMLNAKTEHAINTHIIGYLKKYEGIYAESNIINYEENEWRYLVPDEEGTNWFWSKEEYMRWRNPRNKKDISKVRKPAPTEDLKKHTLMFTLSDIRYILIKDDEFKARLIEFIKTLKTIGGNGVANDAERDDLISKIVTLEQVKRDF